MAAGQRFLADHYDTFRRKIEPSERTLCGHIDFSPRGMAAWQAPYAPAGAVQNKVTDAAGARKDVAASPRWAMPAASISRPPSICAKHPEFAWYQPILRDMPSRAWTWFGAR